MKYLFVCGSLRDNGGFAMIKGAMNGITKLDPSAKFAALVQQKHNKNRNGCISFIYENQLEKSSKWADVFLNVGGTMYFLDKTRSSTLEMARKKGIPYVWMSQSMDKKINDKRQIIKEDLEKTFLILRGQKTTEYIYETTGISPLTIAADLSFLIEPKEWLGEKYIRGYTTYHPLRAIDFVKQMYKTCNKVPSVQIIWKDGKKDEINYFEPRLGIPFKILDVEETFGLVGTLKELHTARYQAGCAAIFHGIKPLMKITSIKYADLMSFYGLTQEELRKSAMQSCQIAVDVCKGKIS